MTQKQISKIGVAALVGAALFATSSAFAATVQMKSIADSWHNLGSGNNKGGTPNGGATANHSGDTAEVCVFCHTPHGGDVSASVPLWNRSLGLSTGSYTRYSSLGTTTFDAEEAPIGSVTIACLSCHDGTQAIDSVLNAPGSGGWTGTAARIGTNFVGTDQSAGVLATGIVQNLGTDLSNDHPVSMQYGGGGVSTTSLNGPTNDRDFVATGNPVPHPQGFTLENTAAPANANINRLWWIERGTQSLNATARDREDVILYTRLETGTGNTEIDNVEQPFVECGSCHDPHNIENQTFLRVSNNGPDAANGFPLANGGPSALCLTCHIK
jgi:hypothetical protein